MLLKMQRKIMLHLNLIMLFLNIIMLHVNFIILYVDIVRGRRDPSWPSLFPSLPLENRAKHRSLSRNI